MSDPLIVTARQLIEDAERRADRAEHEAKFAKIDLEQERLLLKSFMADTLKLAGSKEHQQARHTAERLINFIYDRMNRADWTRDDEDGIQPELVRQQCTAWLTLRIEELTKK